MGTGPRDTLMSVTLIVDPAAVAIRFTVHTFLFGGGDAPAMARLVAAQFRRDAQAAAIRSD